MMAIAQLILMSLLIVHQTCTAKDTGHVMSDEGESMYISVEHCIVDNVFSCEYMIPQVVASASVPHHFECNLTSLSSLEGQNTSDILAGIN